MKKLLISIAILVSFLLCLDSCMQFRMSQTKIDEHFTKRKTKGSQDFYTVNKRKIHYAFTGTNDNATVVFIHGSPGSLGDFIQFLSDSTIQREATLVSVDRPGFGQSGFGRGEQSLQTQAELIKPLLEKFKRDKPLILVGHSLGGPVIARLAMDYPDLIDGLIFVAGSVSPDLEPANWWRAPFATAYFRWMVPRSIRASNDEIYALKSELKEMLPLWKSIKAKVIVIQGTKDSLVPAANAEFIKTQLTNTVAKIVYEEGMDHFVPWSHPHLIKNAVLEMVGELRKDNP